MNILYQIPSCLQHLYRGVVWRGDVTRQVVYLTFDDGPIPEVTPKVLDILREKGVKATFFMVAENASRNPELLAQVRQEGHAIGNHTYNHLKGTRVSTEDYMANVQQADTLLDTRLFRPPYGKMRAEQKRLLLQQGYRIYLWDVLTHDYNPRYSSEQLVRIVKRYVRNGSIINFHDSLKSKTQMLEALPQIINFLKGNGYAMEILS